MSWKKTPEGYEAPGGIHLFQKGKKWYLHVDGKDHEIKSRRPSFDHAEGMLRDMGKKIAYDYDRRASDKDETQTITIEFKDGYGDTAPAILKILQFLKYCGDVGTGQSLRTEYNKKLLMGFDGDGGDRIEGIKLNGKAVEMTKEDMELFKEVTG